MPVLSGPSSLPAQSLASLGWMHLTLTLAHLGVQLASGGCGSLCYFTCLCCSPELSRRGVPAQKKKQQQQRMAVINEGKTEFIQKLLRQGVFLMAQW